MMVLTYDVVADTIDEMIKKREIMIVLILVFVFLLTLSLFLVMSIGVAFCLVWLFPAISFETGVLIGAVSNSLVCYVFMKIIFSIMSAPIININDDSDYDKEDDDYIYEVDQSAPKRRSMRNLRKKRR